MNLYMPKALMAFAVFILITGSAFADSNRQVAQLSARVAGEAQNTLRAVKRAGGDYLVEFSLGDLIDDAKYLSQAAARGAGKFVIRRNFRQVRQDLQFVKEGLGCSVVATDPEVQRCLRILKQAVRALGQSVQNLRGTEF